MAKTEPRDTGDPSLGQQGILIDTPHLHLRLADGTRWLTANPLRELMNHSFPVANLGIGNPASETFNNHKFNEYNRQAEKRYGNEIDQYGPTQGEESFREAIAEYLGEIGVEADKSEIIVVNGAQEVLALAALALITPEVSKVAINDPTYVGFLQANKLFHPNYVTYDEKDPFALEATLLEHPDTAFTYAQPVLGNPTTYTQSGDHRKQIAETLQHHKALLIEDDPYRELYDGDAGSTLFSLAPENVIYAGTFSKMFAPGLRVGWAVIKDPTLRDAFVQIKQGLNIGTTRRYQAIAEAFLRDKIYRSEHKERSVALYSGRRQQAIEVAHDVLPDSWTQDIHDPHGGMFVSWPTEEDTNAIAADVAEQGVAVVPWEMFSTSGEASGIRTNATVNTPDITAKGYSILGKVARKRGIQ